MHFDVLRSSYSTASRSPKGYGGINKVNVFTLYPVPVGESKSSSITKATHRNLGY
jgi:hypothetical protein